jgi:hypothetical protein
MKRVIKFLFILLFYKAIPASGQDTFSICAIDSLTGEVGSAGASCVDATTSGTGVIVISDVHPGLGVIHTQDICRPIRAMRLLCWFWDLHPHRSSILWWHTMRRIRQAKGSME